MEQKAVYSDLRKPASKQVIRDDELKRRVAAYKEAKGEV